MDQFGDHALCCEVGPLRTKRHDALRDIIWHALLTDNSEVKREQRCSSHNHHRPGDIYHPDFLDGKPGFFDIKVRSSLQSRHVISAANSAGAAAQAGELEKDDRHEENVIAASGGSRISQTEGRTPGFGSVTSQRQLSILRNRITRPQEVLKPCSCMRKTW